jgi:N-acetylmuramoyl-L-alanine amidase
VITLKIIPMLIPISNKFTRPGIVMSPKYITIHETDNTSVGANALAHARLQQRGNSRQASWHFQVDDKEIYQSIPTNEIAFHAGDGGGAGNLSSIAIEICVNADGDFEKAKANAVELVRFLMDKYNIPLANVVQHNHWSGKDCPRNMRKSGWNAFIALIKEGATPPNPYPGTLIKLGSKGSVVKEIQKALGGLVVDGVFGDKTLAKVKAFQKSKALVVDGIVGEKTWKALFV